MRLSSQKTPPPFSPWAEGGGLLGVGEHGMAQQRAGERGRSWPFFREWGVPMNKGNSEDIGMTVRKSEGA